MSINYDKRLLERGDKGSAVCDLEMILFQLGYLEPNEVSGEVEGFFNERVENAVKKFQTDRSLPVTGIVTKSDWLELDKAMKEIQ